MKRFNLKCRLLGLVRLLASVALLIAIAAPALHAADNDEDFDSYKIRLYGFWFYSNPTGDFQGSGKEGLINLHKDFGVNSYSTFAGKLDWKFTRKNHLYIVGGDVPSIVES